MEAVAVADWCSVVPRLEQCVLSVLMSLALRKIDEEALPSLQAPGEDGVSQPDEVDSPASDPNAWADPKDSPTPPGKPTSTFPKKARLARPPSYSMSLDEISEEGKDVKAPSEQKEAEEDVDAMRVDTGGFSALYLLCSNRYVLLFMPVQMALGFVESYFNAYVTDAVYTIYGARQVGYYGALSFGFGGLWAVLTYRFAKTHTGRRWAVASALLSFILLPLVAIWGLNAGTPEGERPRIEYMSASSLVIILLFNGVICSVVIGPFRGLMATFVPDQLAEVFSLARFAEGLAAAIGFILCPCKDNFAGSPVSYLVLSFGIISTVSYVAMEYLYEHEVPGRWNWVNRGVPKA